MKAEAFTRAIMSKISEKGKIYQDFFVHLICLLLSLPQRVNFSTMSRYGKKTEKTYRNHFSKPHEMLKFNKHLISANTSKEVFWAFDPSFISKSGAKTYGAGYFWSGSANAIQKGLEIASIAAVDVETTTAWHYCAIQTPARLGKKSKLAKQEEGERKTKKETPWEYYAQCIIQHKTELLPISKVIVQDAYFNRETYVSKLVQNGFEVICKFSHNANLHYLFVGMQPKKRGRPTKYAGKVDFKNLDFQYFTPIFKEPNEIAYEAVVYSMALQRELKIVVLHTLDEKGEMKSVRALFSTNILRSGWEIVWWYHLRFQQEFLFRDAKQFVGLCDCEARSAEKIDYHINACLTAVNVAKANYREENKPFSMADVKTLYSNRLLLDQAYELFISEFGINPNCVKNNPKLLQLYKTGLIAA